jgi:methylmalonyl-CoA/ethylmalonyl-CoA epimerase
VELIDAAPYIGAGGRRIAFIHPRAAHGVLVELYEERPGEVRGLTNLDDLRRRLSVGGRVAAAGTRGFLGGLRKAGPDGGGDSYNGGGHEPSS